jgi:hypothetical protein
MTRQRVLIGCVILEVTLVVACPLAGILRLWPPPPEHPEQNQKALVHRIRGWLGL